MAQAAMRALVGYLPWNKPASVNKKHTVDALEAAELVPLRVSAGDSAASLTADRALSKAIISVKGMHCASCSTAVENAVCALPGVVSASVALLNESAEVTYKPSHLQAAAVVGAINDAGFTARLISNSTLGDPSAGGASMGGSGVGDAAGGRLMTLAVSGMHCSSCSTAVETALRGVPGVERAEVSLTLHQARVALTPAAGDAPAATADDVIEAVARAGFDASLVTAVEAGVTTLSVRGMTCGACSGAVRDALEAVPGVLSAEVDVLGGRARVRYDGDCTGPRALVAAVEGAGFEAGVDALAGSARERPGVAEAREYRAAFLRAAVLTAPLFCVAMVFRHLACMRWLYSSQVLGFPLDQVLKFGFATPVQFVCGARFHRGALAALRRGRANMDVLVSLGTNASYFYSLLSILHHHFASHHVTLDYAATDFFETAGMLITLVLFGKWLEARAKAQTGAALAALCALAPPTAILVEAADPGAATGSPAMSGKPPAMSTKPSLENKAPSTAAAPVVEREIDSALIQRGDLLKVLPGARVPADGVVETGSGHVDESMLTGESAAVPKSHGDILIGGTVNVGGPLRMRATKVGADTTLSQIVRLVEAAQLSKAPIQAVADRLSAVFVPVVVVLATCTLIAWYSAGVAGLYPESWLPRGHTLFLFSLLFGIAVLVIACPCALGLATPTAVMVGTGVGAGLGVLVKGGKALERAAALTTVVFDKTGTLTVGRPRAVDLHVATPGVPARDAVLLAAALEAESEHPLAGAVLTLAASMLEAEGRDDELGVQQQQGGVGVGDGSGAVPGVVSLNDSVTAARSKGWRSAAEQLAGRLPTPTDFKALAGEGVVGRVPLYGVVTSVPDSQATSWFRAPEALLRAEGAFDEREQVGGAGPASSVSVVVGSPRLMAERGVAMADATRAYLDDRHGRGCTCLCVAVGQRLLCVAAVKDALRPEARGVVTALHAAGVTCVLLTGDDWRTARAVAGSLGIRRVVAQVLPAGKVAAVRELQAATPAGGGVAMVGDGVNDSPALAAADVGMALGSGSDVACEAADFVLVRGDLEGVLAAIDLSAAVLRRIRWNYVAAMAYNVLAIPLAAGALYPALRVQLPPWVAGACMALSSVSVVCSSLMLRRYRPPRPVLRDVLVIADDSAQGESADPGTARLSAARRAAYL